MSAATVNKIGTQSEESVEEITTVDGDANLSGVSNNSRISQFDGLGDQVSQQPFVANTQSEKRSKGIELTAVDRGDQFLQTPDSDKRIWEQSECVQTQLLDNEVHDIFLMNDLTPFDISHTGLQQVSVVDVSHPSETGVNNDQFSDDNATFVQLEPVRPDTFTGNVIEDIPSDSLREHHDLETARGPEVEVPIDIPDAIVVIPLDSVRGPEVEVTSEGNQIDTRDEVLIPIENEENIVLDAQPAEPTVNDEDQYPKPRSREPRKWKENKVKELKQSGQAHVRLKGKEREAKSMGAGCSDKCKRKCHFNFTYEDRLKVFNEYYSIENQTLKWYFISNHVRTEDVKRRTVNIDLVGAKKNFSFYFFLPVNGVDKPVCKQFFLHTLATSEKSVRTALEKKKANNGSIPGDGRGKKKKRTEVCSIIRQDVINHIKQYKTVEGHYTRKTSKARYLPEYLNCRMMHAQYIIEREAQGFTQNLASLRQYRDVFKKEFNLKFFRPKKDQCAKCLSYKNKTPGERTEEISRKYEKHISDKKIGQDLKTEDIQFAKTSNNVKSVCVATCDLEKVFLCPKGENSEFYYKSKLSLYNFTIFVSGEQKGLCYVWDQTEARRGSAEISSCLWSFLKTKSEQGIREFRFYSDNCSGQNKNQFLFSMYVMASIRLNIKIVHRYLETGHTHMEVDSVHAAIQNSIKTKEIFVPSEWYTAIKMAKKTLPKYEVIELKQDQIFDFTSFAALQRWESLKTSEFKEVVFNSAEPGIIYYKSQYEENAKMAKVFKRKPGHPVNWKSIALKKMYSAKIPLRPIEVKDLKALCDSGAIPSRYHNYYNTITSNTEEVVQPPPPHDVPEGDQESSGSDSDSGESE